VRNPGRNGSEIRVRNPGSEPGLIRKSGSEIRVENPGQNFKSGNPGQKSGSKWLGNPGQKSGFNPEIRVNPGRNPGSEPVELKSGNPGRNPGRKSGSEIRDRSPSEKPGSGSEMPVGNSGED
jgi:hypothetical protein